AEPLPARARVEGRRDAELRAPRPERVVIVLAVEAERVVPRDEAGGLGVGDGDRVHRARDQAAEHRDLEAELTRAVLELRDGFLGRVHGDAGGGRDPVGEVMEGVGGEDVERATGGPARLVIGDTRDAEAGGGIEHREVQAELVQALVEEPRQQARRPVARVLLGRRPERLLLESAPSPPRQGGGPVSGSPPAPAALRRTAPPSRRPTAAATSRATRRSWPTPRWRAC